MGRYMALIDFWQASHAMLWQNEMAHHLNVVQETIVLVVFLGGLIAIDICSKRASGAAMGLVGMFSYVGAAFQDWISGSLIEAGKMTVNGRTIHDFNNAFYFWLGAAIFAVLVSCTLWKVKPKD